MQQQGTHVVASCEHLLSEKFKYKNDCNNVARRNTGAGLCVRKLKTPFFQKEPRRPVILDEIHGSKTII
jgi:hypothetical protein